MLNFKDRFDLFKLEVDLWQEYFEKNLGIKFQEPDSIAQQLDVINGEKLI